MWRIRPRLRREAFRRWHWWLLCIVALRQPELGEDFAGVFAATYGWVKQLQVAEEPSIWMWRIRPRLRRTGRSSTQVTRLRYRDVA